MRVSATGVMTITFNVSPDGWEDFQAGPKPKERGRCSCAREPDRYGHWPLCDYHAIEGDLEEWTMKSILDEQDIAVACKPFGDRVVRVTLRGRFVWEVDYFDECDMGFEQVGETHVELWDHWHLRDSAKRNAHNWPRKARRRIQKLIGGCDARN